MEELRLSCAGVEQDLSPSPEVVVQEEINRWIHTAVEEGQAAGDEEPVSLPRLSITAQVHI